MMIKDNSGQVSLEYLLIFAISLIILVTFTLPLTELTIENTLDVSDTLDVKSDLSQLSQAICQVYGEGQGSKQTVTVQSSKPITLNIANSYVSSNLKLNNNENKLVKVKCNSNLDKSTLKLNKGANVIIVEWPMNSEKMIISKK